MFYNKEISKELLDKLKIIATKYKCSITAAHNAALLIGLEELLNKPDKTIYQCYDCKQQPAHAIFYIEEDDVYTRYLCDNCDKHKIGAFDED